MAALTKKALVYIREHKNSVGASADWVSALLDTVAYQRGLYEQAKAILEDMARYEHGACGGTAMEEEAVEAVAELNRIEALVEGEVDAD